MCQSKGNLPPQSTITSTTNVVGKVSAGTHCHLTDTSAKWPMGWVGGFLGDCVPMGTGQRHASQLLLPLTTAQNTQVFCFMIKIPICMPKKAEEHAVLELGLESCKVSRYHYHHKLIKR